MNTVIKISRHRNQLVEHCLLQTRQLLRLHNQDGVWKGTKRYAH
ncbi:hypothetical protein [Aestuariivivens sediminicola]|nr:hypothetical protein [Aestuariivivens sediminicola]